MKLTKKQKRTLLSFVAFICIAIIVACAVYIYKKYQKPADDFDDSAYVSSGELEIHFLLLGNDNAGDSIFIKAGDVDILIDAGSTKSSAGTICEYVDKFCKDGKLEYVIATHAHEDHIAGFVGTSTKEGIFEHYECETIIDYPKTESTSALSQDYNELRDAEIAAGAKHFTALECYNEVGEAKREYQLTEKTSFQILYNYYYENDASTENNYSVCVLFECEEDKFLFTGDLEEDGEEKLVQNNASTLGKVKLFKAGHHGSYTASSDALLDVIQPDICVVTCVAGTDEYTSVELNQFPSQDFINRIFKWTTNVYVPCVTDGEDSFKLLCGTIIVSADGKNTNVYCSNQKIKLKDTDWFKENRTAP